MRTVMMILFWAAATAACQADPLSTMDRPLPSSATDAAEISNRDKSCTTWRLGARGVSQAAANSALTKRRSFQAEGTGLEPATACAATDFESVC